MLKELMRTEQGFERLRLFINNASNIVIEDMQLDVQCSAMVMAYLNDNYKKISLDGSKIYSKWQDVFKENNNDIVFYKLPRDRVLFFYNKTPILVLTSRSMNESSTIKYIRGTVNISELVKTAREHCRSKTDETSDVVYFHRFSVYEYHGYSNSYNESSGNVSTANRKINRDSDLDEPKPLCSESLITYKTDPILNYKLSDLNIVKRKLDPFDDLYYPKEVIDIVNDTNEWLKRKEWFIDRGLPYKRGILLYGCGGTGKSSFARAMGVKFGIPVHHMYLSNMTDSEFKSAWNSAVASSPSIVLLEDFDTVFNKRTPVNPKCVLNFDTVLNTISGVQENTGVILIITTNNIDKIDDAIGVSKNDKISTRPGRIDKILHLGAMDDDNRRKLVNKVLKDWPDEIENIIIETNGYTPAQVQEVCIQKALSILHDE